MRRYMKRDELDLHAFRMQQRTHVRDTASKLPPRIARVVAICASDFGVTAEAIMSGARHKHITQARAKTCLTLRRMGLSTPEIGRYLNLHHTAVLYAISRAGEREDSLLMPLRELILRDVPCPDLSGEWAI